MLGQEGAAPRQDTQAGARPAFFISNFRTVLFSLYFFRTGKREKCLSDDCDFLADHTEPAAVGIHTLVVADSQGGKSATFDQGAFG
jgi:hypothetical protein